MCGGPVDRLAALHSAVMSEVQRQFTVSAAQAGRIDRVVQEMTGRSRAGVRGLFDHACVRLNGRVCDGPGTPVNTGDTVEVRHDPQRRYRERAPARSPRGFRLVYEDDDLLVVGKDAALLTVPTARRETNTLVDLVSSYLGAGRRTARAHVVHRLDRGTSGLLVFAKSHSVAGRLHDQFRAHATDREYLAIAAGVLMPPAGTLASRLATGKTLNRYSTRRPSGGEEAVTKYRAERVVRGATLARVWLETGRRNQIRVHFAEAGHPVLGDSRYRPDLSRHPHWTARRLALHATLLGFEHPTTGERLRFELPLPEEFERFLRG